jgi:hypothetical protein
LLSKAQKKPPQIVEDMSNISVRDGCAGSLSCKLKATPDTDITWYRNDKVVKASRDFKPSFDGFVAKLEITEVYPEDAGTYTCKAVNALGECATTAQVSVHDVEPEQMHLTPTQAVEPKTAPIFTQGLLDYSVDEGERAEFEIRVSGKSVAITDDGDDDAGSSGSQPIRIAWFHNGKAISATNSSFKVITDGDLHKLVIPKTVAALKGTYVCEACNDFGDEESSCVLSVLGTSHCYLASRIFSIVL